MIMKNPVSAVLEFISYWYFRYLMVTELYMVEKWERIFCNLTILTIIMFLSFLNCKIVSYSSFLIYETIENITENA